MAFKRFTKDYVQKSQGVIHKHFYKGLLPTMGKGVYRNTKGFTKKYKGI